MSLLNLSIDPAKFRKFGIRKRQLQRATKDSLEQMGRRWHDLYLPEHFKESAYQRYGYYRRKGMGLDPNGRAFRISYAGRKLRQQRHERPLVFSGEGQMLALGPVRLRLTGRQARVVLPSKFNRRHPASRISMRDEITKIIPAEAQDLVEFGRRWLRTVLAQPPVSQ